MIKVTTINNMERKSSIVDPATTLRTVLEAHGVDYSVGTMNLDGSTLQPGALDKTFADFGITTSCYLSLVAKRDNA